MRQGGNGPIRTADGPVSATNPIPTAAADSPALDAFGRARVSLPKLRLSALQDEDLRPLFWDTDVTGSATVVKTANHLGATLTVTASGEVALMQTKEYFVYRAGQSQQVFVTFALQSEDTNVRKEAGYGDDNNGLFLRLDGSTLSFIVRSSATGSVVDTVTTQDAWNIDGFGDPGNPLNPSEITLDKTATQILVVDFQALFVGRVRFGFDIDGVVWPAHDANHANILSIPYISTAKLPVRYRMEATGAIGSSSTMLSICQAVAREGGDDEPNVQHEGRSNANINVGTAWETVLGLRLKAANIRATIRLLSVALFNLASDWIEYCVVLNPSYSGTPTWVDVDTDNVGEIARFNAAISVNAAGDPDVGHTYPLGGFVAGTGGGGPVSPTPKTVTTDLGDTVPIAADIAGTPDEAWVCARASTGTADVRALIAWAEER